VVDDSGTVVEGSTGAAGSAGTVVVGSTGSAGTVVVGSAGVRGRSPGTPRAATELIPVSDRIVAAMASIASHSATGCTRVPRVGFEV
jgi:hypothetical protein